MHVRRRIYIQTRRARDEYTDKHARHVGASASCTACITHALHTDTHTHTHIHTQTFAHTQTHTHTHTHTNTHTLSFSLSLCSTCACACACTCARSQYITHDLQPHTHHATLIPNLFLLAHMHQEVSLEVTLSLLCMINLSHMCNCHQFIVDTTLFLLAHMHKEVSLAYLSLVDV